MKARYCRLNTANLEKKTLVLKYMCMNGVLLRFSYNNNVNFDAHPVIINTLFSKVLRDSTLLKEENCLTEQISKTKK